ncbi:MAG TPA: DUF5107 domain-containing protein [Anaerolineae bacterium]|nr:DUF5107 domain-containing protein [Anaerolineae bacterium]
MKHHLLPWLLLLLLLAACGGKPKPTLAPPIPTRAELPSLASTVSPTPKPTSTPESNRPPTATFTPTTTPSFTPAPSATPSPTPIPTHTPTPSPTPLPLGRVRSDANVRAGPGTNYPIVGFIPAGQAIALLAVDPSGQWYQVDVGDDGESWVAGKLIELPNPLVLPTAIDIPTPPPTPTPGDVVRLYESEVTIPTYPWQSFLTPSYDETTGWTFSHFDREAYQNAQPQPIPQTYRLINLENRWLRVNVLPDLGGRIYQLIYKPTGNNEFYQNPVIKPSPWGPPEMGTGWLAVGGMEWGLPVPEHGYAWGEPWGHITLPGESTQGVTVFDNHQDSVHLSVTLALAPDTSAMQLHFELENLGEQPIPVSFWLDAMLAPGPSNTVGPDLRFFFPIQQASVHSTGDPTLPPPGHVFDWPIYQGRDISRLGNWNQWLGFFAHPQAQADWAAVVDMASDEGVVRVFPSNMTPGLKGFGFGWSQPIPPEEYTDDGSAYVELQGGVTPTYDQRLTLYPGELYAWDEVWYPVVGLRGVSWADTLGAVHLVQKEDGPHLRLVTVRPMTGKLTITDTEGKTITTTVSLAPNAPADIPVPGFVAPMAFHLTGPQGEWELTGIR